MHVPDRASNSSPPAATGPPRKAALGQVEIQEISREVVKRCCIPVYPELPADMVFVDPGGESFPGCCSLKSRSIHSDIHQGEHLTSTGITHSAWCTLDSYI